MSMMLNGLGRYGVAAALCSALLLPAACSESEPKTEGAPPQARLLTKEQYVNAVTDAFGSTVEATGRFAPLRRTDGLLALGAGGAMVTPASLEQFESMARAVAQQALTEDKRPFTVPCEPKSVKEADDACAGAFLRAVGRTLYRRPITDAEQARLLGVAKDATERFGDFYRGLEYALASMLVMPDFLFVKDEVEADPDNKGKVRLTGYAKASRISFFLWNTSPDPELLDAAERGDLHTEKGVATQVNRLLGSPRLEAGLRSFFTDMFNFDRFEALNKDTQIYPAFSNAVMSDAQEQTLRTVVDHLMLQDGDYRDLFTTRKTYMTGDLGIIYQVPVANPLGWSSYEFPEGDARQGILSQLSFTALHSHPGRTSVTLRGKALREIMLCQVVPRPPPNVDFTVVQETDNPVYKTARARVDAHRNDPACAACHKITDPIGLALEQFDGAGQVRTEENGERIDASGDLDGTPFQDASGLAVAVRNHPATTSCLVDRAYSYATGHGATPGEAEVVEYFKDQFAKNKFRIRPLLFNIATSDAFFAVVPPSEAAPVKTASR